MQASGKAARGNENRGETKTERVVPREGIRLFHGVLDGLSGPCLSSGIRGANNGSDSPPVILKSVPPCRACVQGRAISTV